MAMLLYDKNNNDNVKQLGFRRKENPELLEEDEGEDCVGPQTNKCWDEPLQLTTI